MEPTPSLGCGNPTAVAELREGDTVINLSTDKPRALAEIARVQRRELPLVGAVATGACC